MEKIKIFVSYSHYDKQWVRRKNKKDEPLIPWLIRQFKGDDVQFWTDSVLEENHVGEDFGMNIKDSIQNSHIAILLLSQDFVTSKYIQTEELPWIKESFQKGEIKIIPLLIDRIGDEFKEQIQWIFDLQIVPGSDDPLIDYRKDETIWSPIRIKILNLITAEIKKITNPQSPDTASSDLPQPPVYIKEEELLQIKEEGEKGNFTVLSPLIERMGERFIKEVQWILDSQVMQSDSDSPLNHSTSENRWSSMRKKLLKIITDEVEKITQPQSSDNSIDLPQPAVCGGTKELEEAKKLYRRGDFKPAVEWYKKSAENNNPEAQNFLGDLFSRGLHVPENKKKAAELYEKAAKQGNICAQFALGGFYRFGEGAHTPRNYEQAAKYFNMAALQGHQQAQKSLVAMYNKQQYVTLDFLEKQSWYKTETITN
ncbi:MAG: toll/interleukin-1 receptor domain-containing protein [Prevotellaceae bacterium]|jgi:tetratricopeptide (TPR) repeat protein|nr:toll/interleukin-1 receptor domain-containing protein [Prevotellaceae bacterium]